LPTAIAFPILSIARLTPDRVAAVVFSASLMPFSTP